MTAQTAAASTVPHPFGSPAGPGLFHMKGAQLPAYVQNIAHALLRSGSAHDESSAIQMAVGICQRWAAGIGAKGKKVHPDVQAAAAKAIAEWESLKAAAHAHANEAGGAVDLSAASLHVPAGSSNGGQFGTNSGGTAGKTPAQQHKLHQAHVAHLQRLVAQGKATPAQKAELARLTPKPAAVKVAAVKAAVAKPKAAKVKATPGHPIVNKKKGTVTAVVNGKQVTMRLHEWHVIHVAHQQAVARQKAMQAGAKFAGDSDRFLDLAFTEALAERVPPGRPEGGRFTPAIPALGRYDTPAQTARAVNALERPQRAAVRATTMVPPGMTWTDMDRLAIAVTR